MLTFRMAANAIWNKINIALALTGEKNHAKQCKDSLLEARELANSIVHHPRSED